MAKTPLPVNVENEEPLQVEVHKDKTNTYLDQEGQRRVTPTTTEEENRVTEGQRKVNLIWEGTQSLIAISITFAVISSALMQIDSLNLTNAFFLIIGFYFSRTNHQAVGGVGRKTPLGPYLGR